MGFSLAANKLIKSVKKEILSISQDGHLKEVFAGSSIAFVFNVIGIGGRYVFAFIISRNYGTKGVGLYSLTLSILIVFEMLSTMGFQGAILRFVGQYYAENKYGAIRGLYKQMLGLSLPASLFLALLFWLFSFQLSTAIFHDVLLKIAFQITSLMIPFYIIGSLNIELIRSLRNILLSEYLRDLNKPFLGILILVIIRPILSNLYVPIAAFLLASLGGFFISTFYIRKKLAPYAKQQIRLLSNKELTAASFPMMISAFSFFIMGYIDTLMLGMYSTIENVGIYNIAVRLASITSLILLALNIMAGPKISELYWSGNFQDLRRVVRFSTKLAFWFSLPLLVAYISIPKFFMGIFGSEFTKGGSALIILGIGQFVNATCGIVGEFLNMTGRQRIFRNIVLCAAAIDIVLCYFLIPKYGVNGAAVATMISVIFWNITSVLLVNKSDAINTFYVPFISR